MYLCYLDESGTPHIPGTTSHYVLAGLAVPVWHWRDCDRQISGVKKKYDLENAEIHAAWILRKYASQYKISDFEKLSYDQRRYEVSKLRKSRLLALQKAGKPKKYRQTRKNFLKTDAYVHLTHAERVDLIRAIAQSISGWGFARLFAESVDKIHFDPARSLVSVDEQAFEQIVSRFETFLAVTRSEEAPRNFGVLIHDNNQTVAKRHTDLMMKFHQKGTLWTEVQNIIETPLFVDSELTSMVQMADLCAYALRRYSENGEEELFDLVFERADRKNQIVVGVRHFSDNSCQCKICLSHSPN